MSRSEFYRAQTTPSAFARARVDGWTRHPATCLPCSIGWLCDANVDLEQRLRGEVDFGLIVAPSHGAGEEEIRGNGLDHAAGTPGIVPEIGALSIQPHSSDIREAEHTHTEGAHPEEPRARFQATVQRRVPGEAGPAVPGQAGTSADECRFEPRVVAPDTPPPGSDGKLSAGFVPSQVRHNVPFDSAEGTIHVQNRGDIEPFHPPGRCDGRPLQDFLQ